MKPLPFCFEKHRGWGIQVMSKFINKTYRLTIFLHFIDNNMVND